MADKTKTTKKEYAATCAYKNAKISPSKVRLTANEIRGSKVKEALSQLSFYDTKAAKIMNQTLKSAIANAKQNGYEEDSLFIENVVLGPGRTLKTGRIVSKGQMHPILKRSSHIVIQLGSLKPADKKETPAKKTAENKAKSEKGGKDE